LGGLDDLVHLYRWDLDRTYLDTDIHSVRGLVRTAMERATDKRNVPGATTLMRELARCDPSARVTVLSGSPTQLRQVLTDKLALDGVRIDALILKDNLGNLRRGRLRAVRGQIGYKLPELLRQRIGVPAAAGETLFGDDTESDAWVYATYAEALAGRLPAKELADLLVLGGAYPDQIDAALASLARLESSPRVEEAFIHLDRRSPLSRFDGLGPLVAPVFAWMQAACRLHARGRLDDRGLVNVIRHNAEEASLAAVQVAGLLQDAARRGLADSATLLRVIEASTELQPIRKPAIQSLSHTFGDLPPQVPALDLRGWLQREIPRS
jgi:hypothetical protein